MNSWSVYRAPSSLVGPQRERIGERTRRIWGDDMMQRVLPFLGNGCLALLRPRGRSFRRTKQRRLYLTSGDHTVFLKNILLLFFFVCFCKFVRHPNVRSPALTYLFFSHLGSELESAVPPPWVAVFFIASLRSTSTCRRFLGRLGPHVKPSRRRPGAALACSARQRCGLGVKCATWKLPTLWALEEFLGRVGLGERTCARVSRGGLAKIDECPREDLASMTKCDPCRWCSVVVCRWNGKLRGCWEGQWFLFLLLHLYKKLLSVVAFLKQLPWWIFTSYFFSPSFHLFLWMLFLSHFVLGSCRYQNFYSKIAAVTF